MNGNRTYDKEAAEIRGGKDAARDPGAGVEALVSLGFLSNSSYDPPKDPELKAHYDAGWKEEKGKK